MRFKQDSVVLLLVAALIAVSYGAYRTGRRDPLRSDAHRPPLARGPVDRRRSEFAHHRRAAGAPADHAGRAPVRRGRAAPRRTRRWISRSRRPCARPPARRARSRPRRRRSTRSCSRRCARSPPTIRRSRSSPPHVAKASPSTAQSLNDRLNLAKAQLALDQDEVDDARQDLRRAGGDPQGRMQAMIDEHDAASRSSDSVHVDVTPAAETRGLVRRVQALQALYAKAGAARSRPKAAADSLADAFKKRHDRIEARAARMRDSAVANLSHDSSAALLALHTAQRAGGEGQGDARPARRQPAPPLRRLHRMDRRRVDAGARGRQPRAARPRASFS